MCQSATGAERIEELLERGQRARDPRGSPTLTSHSGRISNPEIKSLSEESQKLFSLDGDRLSATLEEHRDKSDGSGRWWEVGSEEWLEAQRSDLGCREKGRDGGAKGRGGSSEKRPIHCDISVCLDARQVLMQFRMS